jgi:hypothetical protein
MWGGNLLELSALRDLILVIWGLVATAATIYLCILVSIFYKRLSSFLLSMDMAASKIREIADQAQDELLIPLKRIGSLLRGINQAFAFIDKLFNKKEKTS